MKLVIVARLLFVVLTAVKLIVAWPIAVQLVVVMPVVVKPVVVVSILVKPFVVMALVAVGVVSLRSKNQSVPFVGLRHSSPPV